MEKRLVLQTAQAGNANGNMIDFVGAVNLAVQVDASGFTGTVNFEGSTDGVNFYPVPMQKSDGAWVSTTGISGLFSTKLAPFPIFRARTSSVIGGTVTVTAFAKSN